MYNNKKKKKTIVIVIIIISILAILGTVIFLLKKNNRLLFTDKLLKDGVLFISNIISAPINFIDGKIEENNEKVNLYEKYKLLRERASVYDAMVAENAELKKEIDDMKKMLDLNSTLSENSYINATVVNRNLGYWYNNITIDKGSNNGIEEGMAAIVDGSLIGKIVSVSNFTSTVKLLTNEEKNANISVKIDNDGTYLYGLLTGYDTSDDLFKIEGISESVGIKSDSLVTTTGLGDLFPSGILIGKVSSTSSDHFDLAKIIDVKSNINFNDITMVTILKKEASK